MKIHFFVVSPYKETLKDLTWCENNPLGGSETAMLRLASALKKLGNEIEILTDLSELKANSCDVFVSLRTPHIFTTGVRYGKLHYLWCHDDIDQPFIRPLKQATKERQMVYDAVDTFVLLSHYQYHRWLKEFEIPHEKTFISSNGIFLEAYKNRKELSPRPPQAYYASTPFRGLDLLLKAWPYIYETNPRANLKIFSSMKVYKAEEREGFEEMYQKARAMPGVDYRGSVGQAELREAAFQSRVLAYPCTFPETSCIAAMEAMAAGCVVVSSSTGAMPETAWRNPLFSPFEKGWLETWAMEVSRLFVDNEYYEDLSRQNREISKFFDWQLVAQRWMLRFRSDFIMRGISFRGTS